jgi:hypothetical protein
LLLRVDITFALPKPRVRWPRQDDGAASGSRAELVRVKPDKHRPVLWDEKKLPDHESVGDGVLDVPCPLGYNQAPHKALWLTNNNKRTAQKVSGFSSNNPFYPIPIRAPQPRLSSAE